MSAPRWVTQWPTHLQQTFGSSSIDWTKVEVVPAAHYDALKAIIDANLATHQQVIKRYHAIFAERKRRIIEALEEPMP